MTKLVESPGENIPVYTAYPKMLPYSMVYVQGMSGSGPMVWSAAGDSSCSESAWWTPSMSSQQNPSMASMPNAVMAPNQSAASTMIPAMQMQMQNQQLQALQQQALQMQLQQNAMQQTAMQQNAMQSMSTQMPQNTSQSSTSSMQVPQTQLQVPQLQPQMGQQMPLQSPQMTQMGQQPLQQLQQAPVQLPLQPLQQNQLAADSQEKGERKDLPRRPDRRKLINQSLPSPVVVEEPQPLAVLPSEEVSEKAPGKQRRRRKESGKSESSRFATLRGDLEHGGNEATAAIAQIRGHVLHLAMESESSSRAVQMALKVANRQTATGLSLELSGHIAEVALSLHGNHVLQRAIEVLPAAKSHFIAEELQPRAAEVARNVFGCRIFCRLLEQSATFEATQELISKVLKDSEDLVQHQFGRFVAQAILEHGLDQQRHILAQALRTRVIDMAQHRKASHVIEKSLLYCSAIDRRALALELLKQANSQEDSGVETLARTQYGGFVVKALLNLGGDIEQEARRQLSELRLSDLKAASKETRFVERLLKELNYVDGEKPGDMQNRRSRRS